MIMPACVVELYSRAFSARSRLINVLVIAATLVLAACSSLPTNVQRTPSYALPDTSSTRLGSDIRPLVQAHPGLSGFHVLYDGADAFAARLRLIRAAEKLNIVSPYFVPGEEFTRFLTDKAKQGVRVRILTNSLESNDVAMVHAGYMRYREDLIAGGVELYEFKAVRSRKLDEEMAPTR